MSNVTEYMSPMQRRVVREANAGGWEYNDDRSVDEAVMIFEKDDETLYVDMEQTYVRAFWDSSLHITGKDATNNLLAYVAKF